MHGKSVAEKTAVHIGFVIFLHGCRAWRHFETNNKEHVYMKPEVNSNRFEISLRGKISLRCKVTSLFAFT